MTARRSPQARRADKYELYQRAVQVPEADVRFLRRVFRGTYGRDPHTLREDFCGAGALACEWVRSSPRHRAWGVDLDPEPLGWGEAHNRAALPEAAVSRVKLLRGDVRRVRHEKVDVTVGFNFSYFLFKTRRELRGYFEKARTTLKREGLFVLDCFGGSEAYQVMEESTDHGDFEYRWEQARFDPISMEIQCYIHFDFPDGSTMARAFRYDWRMWSLREIRELLDEAGFRSADVFWEGTERDSGEGNGVFTRRVRGNDDPAWVAYVVARP